MVLRGKTMKTSFYVGLIAVAISGLSACTSYNYYEAGLNRTNLSNYRSFAWMPSGKAQADDKSMNMIADAKIKDAATEALTAKGLKLQQNDPDLIISYSTQIGRGVRTNYYPTYGGYYGMGFGGFYPGFGWGGGWGGWYRPNYYAFMDPFMYGGGISAYKEHYKEGTIIIDLIDRRSREVVWRGFGVGEAHRNKQKDVDDLPKVVNGVLKQLSLAPSSAPPAGGSGGNDRRQPRFMPTRST